MLEAAIVGTSDKFAKRAIVTSIEVLQNWDIPWEKVEKAIFSTVTCSQTQDTEMPDIRCDGARSPYPAPRPDSNGIRHLDAPPQGTPPPTSSSRPTPLPSSQHLRTHNQLAGSDLMIN